MGLVISKLLLGAFAGSKLRVVLANNLGVIIRPRPKLPTNILQISIRFTRVRNTSRPVIEFGPIQVGTSWMRADQPPPYSMENWVNLG